MTKLMSLKGSSNKWKYIFIGSVNFNDLFIRPELKFPTKFKGPNFRKYDGKSCLYAHRKVYEVAMV